MERLIVTEMKEQYFTNMYLVFNQLDDVQLDSYWLVSDFECNMYECEEVDLRQEFLWIRGYKLKKLLKKYSKLQFIWGVFTCFSKQDELEEIKKMPLPYANGNSYLWEMNVEIQNPLGVIEFIAWDATYFIALSKVPGIIEKIKDISKNYEEI